MSERWSVLGVSVRLVRSGCRGRLGMSERRTAGLVCRGGVSQPGCRCRDAGVLQLGMPARGALCTEADTTAASRVVSGCQVARAGAGEA